MAKKSSSTGFSTGCLIAFLIIVILISGGIFAGFYLLQNGNPFVASDDPAIIDIADIRPGATQIPETSAPITPETAPDNPTFARILAEVNQARVDAGLNPLRLNILLSRAAAEQAVYTASIYDATHQDANGNQADVRVTAQGYSWRNVGENLLANWSLDGQRAFILWQGSPSHNANMMNPDFTEMGLAYMVTPVGQVYHAMVLARPG